MHRHLADRKGVAMTIVMIVLMILVMLAAYILNLGYNRRRVIDAASGTKARIYYRAQAGVYHATARIKKNYTAGLVPAGTFTDSLYNPAAYNIDVDGNGSMDTTIDIGPVNADGQRPIVSTGLDQEL